MRLISQKQKIVVRNINDGNEKNLPPRHSALLPNTIRALIVGPSNCGKTNIMLGLLGFKFENIYIFSKSLYQPKYEYLEKLIKPIKGMGYYTFSHNEAKNNSIIIFDDVACEKQDNIRSYFCMGRHKNIISFYLCQTYSHIPKHRIRDNANFIIMFKQDDLSMRHIYRDHINTDMNYETFVKICQKCWEDKHGFLLFSKDNEMDKGRYRKGFYKFIII